MFQKEFFDGKIRDGKLQCNINREAAKISALSSGKIDKYGNHTDEEILPPDQRRMIEQATFTYFLLGKASEKEIMKLSLFVSQKLFLKENK